MAKRKAKKPSDVVDYPHESASRINIPPAGLAARGNIVREGKIRYSYNPHLPPALWFDETGSSDRITEVMRVHRLGDTCV